MGFPFPSMSFLILPDNDCYPIGLEGDGNGYALGVPGGVLG